jgi:hypothetical protein
MFSRLQIIKAVYWKQDTAGDQQQVSEVVKTR